MQIYVLYFASLREERQCEGESITLTQPIQVGALFEQIFSRKALGLRFAVNQSYVPANTILEDGDEVAFIPPLGGG